MSRLDRKIKACEDFLSQYRQYQNLRPGQFADRGELPTIIYRAKIALVLQFLKTMGIKKELGYLDEFVISEEDIDMEFFYPDIENFEQWQCASPYTHFWCMDATRYELGDIVYTSDSEDESDEDKIGGLKNAVMSDLDGFPITEEVAADIAEFIYHWFAYEEYDLHHYAQWDELYPYFWKRCMKLVEDKKDKNVAGEHFKEVLTVKNKDAYLIAKLFDQSLPVESEYSVYEPMKKEEHGKIQIFTFGADASGMDPYNLTYTNFVYLIEQALIQLYIFRLDKKLHFLPENFKGGESKIFPKFK